MLLDTTISLNRALVKALEVDDITVEKDWLKGINVPRTKDNKEIGKTFFPTWQVSIRVGYKIFKFFIWPKVETQFSRTRVSILRHLLTGERPVLLTEGKLDEAAMQEELFYFAEKAKNLAYPDFKKVLYLGESTATIDERQVTPADNATSGGASDAGRDVTGEKTYEDGVKEAALVCTDFPRNPECNMKEHDERYCARCEAMDDAAELLERRILSLLKEAKK